MVASYVGLLAKRYQGKLDQEADEFIGFAVDGARRAQELVRAILSYSRVDTGAKEFERVDCERILGDVLLDLKVAVEESGAKITAGPLPSLRADHVQMAQLLQNLIGNAIKYRRKDVAPEIRVTAVRCSPHWEFTVADNGIGFEMEYAERIFEPFQRLHGGEYPGMGIGLATCRKIVDRHGGRIWVASEPGRGSVVRFTIPSEPRESLR